MADGDWIAIDGSVQAGDRIVIRGGETLRGKEKLDIVGVFEEDVRSANAGAAPPTA